MRRTASLRSRRLAGSLAALTCLGLVVTTVPADAAAATAATGTPAAESRTSVRAASTAAADARIAAKLAKRIKAGALGRDTAVRVINPATGRTVFARQSKEAQLPASNMKLVTAFDALTVLGPDARFPTRVVRGTSPGSIVVVGGGDPLLSSKDLRTLANRTVAALTAASPTKSRPKVLKVGWDDSLFPRPSRATGWRSSYGLGEISPVRALGRHGVASWDTTTDAMGYFLHRLDVAGVSVQPLGPTNAAANATPVTGLAGRRVEAAVRQMLLTSDNQVAEVLFRQVALATGRPATWAGAAAAARATLREAGVPVAKLRLRDGSGLSRASRVTAKAMASLMVKASAGTDPRLASLVTSLPVAGRSGTLRTRYWVAPASCARGTVRAKTGFIDGVVALSGVTVGADGERRTFSIVANHIPSRRYSVVDTQRAVDRLAATVTGCY